MVTEAGGNTTTAAPYSISRFELGQILGRNFRGLKRVGDIEFKDAFNVNSSLQFRNLPIFY